MSEHEPYEAPAIEFRETVRDPLIGISQPPPCGPVWHRPDDDQVPHD